MHLAPGEPPLPGLDRQGRELPPEWLARLLRRTGGFRYRLSRALPAVKRWIENGCPLIPKFSMNSRSPYFVVLVISLFALGMILPELLGLTSGGYGYPSIP